MFRSMVSSLLLSSALAWGVAVAPAAAQSGKQDFTLVNRTGYTISEVYVSPTKSDDWEEDVLGKDTLEDGDATHIRFQRSAKACKWDLKVIYEDDDSDAYWTGVNLCEVSKITIHYNREANETSADFE